MEFLLLLYADQAGFEKLTPAEAKDAMNAYGAYTGALQNAGVLRGSNRLRPTHTATTVRFEGASEPIVRDGPFIEGNEVIGGYVAINVADLDEALVLAKSWPGGGSVEIRPTVEQ